ncbi:MAG: alpha-1,2-fucosyltransferase [Myxococcales bacterium]|nr:alpha-1,2-fucosyltransferase [Myxococcales bacterium]
MIIVKVYGGLGNQMFQYAAGRRLALHHDVRLKLDLSWFPKQRLRSYGLTAFQIQADVASPSEIERLAGSEDARAVRFLRRVLGRPRQRPPSHYSEVNYDFDPSVLNLPSSSYLDGYWQNERYFEDQALQVRKDFELNIPLSERSLRFAEEIANSSSIGIHIRRGDYVSSQKTQDFHGVCGADYYHRALELVLGTTTEPHLFVFSDDPTWARTLNFGHRTTIVSSHEPSRDFEELWLLSRCNHHVISNSSFSWWAAWLAPHDDARTCAPRLWFQDPSLAPFTPIPSRWRRT